MPVKGPEEGLVVAVFPQFMADGFGRAQLFLVPVVDVPFGQGLGQGGLGKSFAPGHRQLPHVQQDVDLGLIQRAQKILQNGAFIADRKQPFHFLSPRSILVREFLIILII